MARSEDSRKSWGTLTIQYRNVVEWGLLHGNRLVIAAGLLLVLYAILGGLIAAGIIGIEEGDPVTRSLSDLIGGNLTILTIVISINQLILSRGFGTPKEFEDRIDRMFRYREQVEKTAETAISPDQPKPFLTFLADETRQHAADLRKKAADIDNEQLRDDVMDWTQALSDRTEQTRSLLEQREYSSYRVLLSILTVDFTDNLYGARRIRAQHDDALPDAETQILEETIELIEFFEIARQYFKTVYLQRELADLSRKLLYTGIPAILAALLAVWLYGNQPRTITGAVFQAIVPLFTVIALGPIAVFFAFIVRAATIAKRTASLLPFDIHYEDSH